MKVIVKNKNNNILDIVHNVPINIEISFLKDIIIKKWKLKKVDPFDIQFSYRKKILSNLQKIPIQTSEEEPLIISYKEKKICQPYEILKQDLTRLYKEIYLYTKERVVEVITPNGARGAGTLISKNGHIWTAKHCWTSLNPDGTPIYNVKSEHKRIIIFKGNRKKCKYVWHSDIHDYMICKIENNEDEEYPYFNLEDSGTDVGELIFLMGFPEQKSNNPVITHGIISHADRGFRQPFVYFSTDAESLNGQSGGPIVSIFHNCRGIHIGRHPEHSCYATSFIPVFVFIGEILAHSELYGSIFYDE